MAFTPEEIEYYHNRGLMPDWAYYQQNGKSAQENYVEQHRKMQEEYYIISVKAVLGRGTLGKLFEKSFPKTLQKLLK
jgi:hypothetical protein